MKSNAIYKKKDNTKIRLRLWLRLLKLSSEVEAELRRRLKADHGTTLPRFDVLAALFRYPEGLKMSELSTHLKVSNGNVTGIVDRLTKEGLALRVAMPGDRRAYLARLTPEGQAVFSCLAENHENWINDLFKGLTSDEVEALTRSLEKAISIKEQK